MALSNTAQPINASLRKIAVVVATAVAGMSAYAQAADTPKRRNHHSNRRSCCAGKCLGSGSNDCGKTHRNGDKTDTPIEKTPQSISVVTREEMDMKQPGTVKQALAYTPSVFATRGSSPPMTWFHPWFLPPQHRQYQPVSGRDEATGR
jgi:iron complex outermembrane receptor protein